MADQAFNEFYELIRRQYTDVDDNKAEGASKILQYTSQVRNIRFLFDFLERCANSDLHLICSFNFISEIMKKKGCLVPPSSLLEYFSFIERFIIEEMHSLRNGAKSRVPYFLQILLFPPLVGHDNHSRIKILQVAVFQQRILYVGRMFHFKKRIGHAPAVYPHDVDGRASLYHVWV